MIRSVYCIYQTLLKCIPKKWKNKPPLVWHWDSAEMAKYIKVEDFDLSDGFSSSAALAYHDDGTEGMPEAIHVPVELSWKPLAKIVITLLHELAHANKFDGESEADEAALKIYKTLNKKEVWKELGIKLRIRRTKDKAAIPSDLIYAEPARLTDYAAFWEDGEARDY